MSYKDYLQLDAAAANVSQFYHPWSYKKTLEKIKE